MSRVRLVGTHGRSIDDQGDEGYALLMGDLPFGESYVVELLDAPGRPLAEHLRGALNG